MFAPCTVPNFMVRIEPRSDELTVGDEAIIDCTVSTVSGVELSSVMISWIGPRGVITNDSRVTITPTTSSDNSFNNSVIFEYLEEINIGTYTCNVMILDTSRSQSVELSSLNVTSESTFYTVYICSTKFHLFIQPYFMYR